MGKLVILKFGAGSLAQGFPVTLQIGEETTRPTLEIAGSLPPAPELLQAYQQWQTMYRHLDLRGRPLGLPKPTNVVTIADCQTAADQLRDRCNHWLQTASFRPLREKWLETLQPTDTVRVILQTDDYRVQKLPWHLWDLIERYPHAEIALAVPAYEQIARSPTPSPIIRILAILGNSDGIDIQTDRTLLAQLPHAQVEFLVEPRCEALTDRLWEQPWDLLFFAGHSSSQPEGASGSMAINATESLSIKQLKYALRQAVERGLTLAIFNSCDGLGLAREFADLQIPQLIVMREPIPDRVAHTFLKHFLTTFSQGESFYLAVRAARERLQGLETQFPCATWLPVIFQHPAARPLTWPALLPPQETPTVVQSPALPVLPMPQPSLQRHWRAIAGIVPLVSLGLTAAILGVRHGGWLQALELPVFDQMLQQRPDAPPDARILVITVTEADVQTQPPDQRRGSLSDAALAKVLEKLEPAQPRLIGLDIYRDYPVGPGYAKLATRLQKSDRLIAVCKVSSPDIAGVAPPPEVDPDRLGFSDLALDRDHIVRRQLLALDPPPNSPCPAAYAFSTQLALQYLAQQGIELQFMPDGAWKLGNTVIKPLESHFGGYQGIDAWGHQILLNYRSYRSIGEIAPQITLSQVLAGPLNPAIVKDRIVLIGTTAASFHDVSLTPYKAPQGNAQSLPGVMLQAQLISQLLSAVLDRRSLLWVLPWSGDAIWIWAWALAGSGLGLLRRPQVLGLAVFGAIAVLYGACLGLLIGLSCWLPFVPAVLALLGSSSGTLVLTHSLARKNHA